MSTRIQTINNDTVLEVTETVPVKTRHSKTSLLRQQAYFESMVEKGQKGLEGVRVLLNQIDNEQRKAK